MALTTFYLKYRPQKISQLDLTEVREELQKIAKSQKFPHALLFAGPKGTGKTSAARIFAKVVNCQNLKNGEPCNECDVCQEISQGTALDLIEIDAASNRGIDDIRELREKIKLSPVKFKYKVYIIDEVHMLTNEAFNALLKTLEEPPPHAIFILCTTEPEKLPETIVSRCVRLNFRKAKIGEIVEALKRAVEGEKIKIEEGVLGAIAAAVDGSFRDAHKILEQLTLGREKITLKEAKKVLEQTEEFSPKKLLQFLAAKDIAGGLGEIERLVGGGGDLEIYTLRLLEILRKGLLAKIGVEREEPEILKNFSEEEIKKLIALFTRASYEMKFSPIPQLPLELAVVEWGGERKNPCPTASDRREKSNINSSIDSGLTLSKVERVKNQKENSSSQTQNPNPPKANIKMIEDKWTEILAKIKPLNHSVEAFLKASRPLNFDGDFLILEVFYKFHKERLETEKCRRIVEGAVEEVLGMPVKLKCVLGEKPIKNSKEFSLSQQSQNEQEEGEDILEIANNIFNGKII